MKRIPLLILILQAIAYYQFASPASAGLIFDNGSGDKNDTLVVQFCLLDSSGQRYKTFDTAYVFQAYCGIPFNVDTLLAPAEYDLAANFPGNLMFEHRMSAGDGNPAHFGAYTYWVLLIGNNSGTDSHHMHKGWYYVSDDPIEDLLAFADTSAAAALGKNLRDAFGDSIPSIVAKILTQPSNRLATDASGRVMISSVTEGAIDSAAFAAAYFRAMTRYFWTDMLTDYNPDPDEAHTLLKQIHGYTDGDGSGGIDEDIAALSISGGGSEACTLVVSESGGGPIFGARILIRTLDQTAVRVPGLFTDTNGKRALELDAESYFISITANNYVPLNDTLIVWRDSTWNFQMAPYHPGDPPSPDLCRVYGWVYDIGGEEQADVTIRAEIPPAFHPVKYGNIVITPFDKCATSDSTGYWQIDLFPNVLLSDPSSKYEFTIEYPSGVILRSETAVPDSQSWLFR